MNLTAIADSPVVVVSAIFAAFLLVEVATGRFRQPEGQRRDLWIELIGSSLLVGATFPVVVFLATTALAALAWAAGFTLFLVLDDMTQYWWHRLSHHVPWLYGLHRAHHSAAYMSVRIVYRNNSFYYLLMPGIWLSAALVYLGLAHVYYVYLIVKMTVIFGAHSSIPWDARLYGVRALRPLAWVLERTISTPATHAAHHGLSADDGVTHYKGNFGNLLFLWDVLFGTARITRRRPPRFGIEHLAPVSWPCELFWPLVRRSRDARRARPAHQIRSAAAR
jgi:sterol desaturase/sphingolipid hydroxylase (fatty acid hydroxylase superfamily)